jgi:hypothetical protein
VAKDALLQVTGPTAGTAIEAAAITIDGDGGGGYKFVGKYQSFLAEVRVGGAFDRTTGNETLAVTVTEATDAAGTSAAIIATGPTITATHAAVIDETSQYGKTTPALADGPQRFGFSTGSGGWVKVSFDVGGTTPSATGVSVDLIPVAGSAIRASGS